jgi:hypothetical protein
MMPLSLLRLSGPKMGDLDWREQDALRSLLGRAHRGSSDPQELLREATGRLHRRVVNQLVDEAHAGIEHLKDVWIGNFGLERFDRSPAAAVVALAWLRAAERMLEAGISPRELGNLVVLFAVRDEAEPVMNG